MTHKEPDQKRLLAVSFVARKMCVAPRTVRDWIRAKRIVAIKTPGGYYRIPASELDRILSSQI